MGPAVRYIFLFLLILNGTLARAGEPIFVGFDVKCSLENVGDNTRQSGACLSADFYIEITSQRALPWLKSPDDMKAFISILQSDRFSVSRGMFAGVAAFAPYEDAQNSSLPPIALVVRGDAIGVCVHAFGFPALKGGERHIGMMVPPAPTGHPMLRCFLGDNYRFAQLDFYSVLGIYLDDTDRYVSLMAEHFDGR